MTLITSTPLNNDHLDWKNRIGKVTYTNVFFQDHPEVLYNGLLDLFPVRIINNIEADTVTIVGHSKHFDVISTGEKIPEYKINVTRDASINIHSVYTQPVNYQLSFHRVGSIKIDPDDLRIEDLLYLL